MRYAVVIEKGPSSVGAYAPDFPGCVAVGDTEAEALKLLEAALPDHIQLMREHGEIIPPPTTTVTEIEVVAAV